MKQCEPSGLTRSKIYGQLASNSAPGFYNEEVRCALSNKILHSRMTMDPTHVGLERTCVRPVAFLSGVHYALIVAIMIMSKR
jgi:hypothetical protein